MNSLPVTKSTSRKLLKTINDVTVFEVIVFVSTLNSPHEYRGKTSMSSKVKLG